MSSRDRRGPAATPASAPAPVTAPKPAGAPAPKELGWLPDCVYTGDKFESGLAFFADAAGRITRFSREPADLEMAKRLPGQAALPGLVNTHSHARPRILRGRVELKARAGAEQVGNSHELMERALARLTDEDVYDAAREVFLEMLLAGITTVGECHFLHHKPDGTPWPEAGGITHAVLRAANDVGLRIALLHGVALRAGFKQPVGSGQARSGFASVEAFTRATEALFAYVEKNLPGDDVWVGVAPHSLGAVPIDALKAISAYAHTKRCRVHLALGETAAEREACLAEYGRSPAALLADHGLLDKRFTAVHGTHLSDEDIRALGAARVTMCACPASELAAGEGAFPLAKFLAAGAPLALGTDAQWQINLLEDARLLEFQARGERARPTALPADLATPFFHAATVSGARSLGAPGGMLEVGRPADFFTVNLYDPSLVGASPEALLGAVVFASSPRAIREVWVGARQRVSGWKHPLQSTVVGRFADLQKKLWS
jgi:formimidoylglutamate deiminase